MQPIKLKVTLNEAKNLKIKEPNPFVVINLSSDDPSAYKTSAKLLNTPNPIWDEVFEFLVEDVLKEKVNLVLYNGSETRPMADELSIPISQIRPGMPPTSHEFKLMLRGKDAGQIKLTFESFQATAPKKKKAKPKVRMTDVVSNKSKAKRVAARKSDAKRPLRRSSAAKRKSSIAEDDHFKKTYYLNIEVVAGRNLLSADKKGRLNPYIVVQLEGNPQKLITKPVKESLNPVFGQVFEPYDGYFVSSDLLHFWVFHNQKDEPNIEKDEVMGLANFLVSDIGSLGKVCDIEIPLFKAFRDKKTGEICQEKRSRHGDAGYLVLKIHAAQIGDSPWQEDPWKADFLEAYLEMKDAKKCPVMDGVQSSDPYVTLQVSPAANKQLYKTIVQKQTLNPVWNERVKFSIDDPQTQLIHFSMFHELAKMGKTKISLKGLRIGEIVDIETQLSKVQGQKGGTLRYRLTLVYKNQKPFVKSALPPDMVVIPKPKPANSNPERCKWFWPSYGSSFSDSFDGYTDFTGTLSDFHSWEERWHNDIHKVEPEHPEYIKLTRGIITGKIISCTDLIKLDGKRTDAYIQINVLTKGGRENGGYTLTPVIEDESNPVYNFKYQLNRIKKGDVIYITALQRLFDTGPCQLGVIELPIRAIQPGKQVIELEFRQPTRGTVPTNMDRFQDFGKCKIKINYDLNE